MDRHFKKFFEDDPFFSGMPSFDMPLSLTDGRSGRGKEGGQQRSRSMDPFSDMFRGMEDMRNNMMKSFEMMDHNGGNHDGHSFRSSSIMTYSNDGKSKPKYYQATSSVRTAPGQLKETRKTVRDSEKELEKMAIGHHMGQRGKVVERRRIRGEEEEEQNYLHMDESDGPAFDKEWQRRASDFMDIPTMQDSRFANAAGLPSAPRRSSEGNMRRSSRNKLSPSLEVQGKQASKNKRLQFK